MIPKEEEEVHDWLKQGKAGKLQTKVTLGRIIKQATQS